MPDRKLYLIRKRKGLCVYCGKNLFIKGYAGCRKCLDKQCERRKESKGWVDPKLKLIELFGKDKIVEKV